MPGLFDWASDRIGGLLGTLTGGQRPPSASMPAWADVDPSPQPQNALGAEALAPVVSAMARPVGNAFDYFGRTLRGEEPLRDPETGGFTDAAYGAAGTLAGLGMTGGVAGTGPGGVALGAGPIRRALPMDEASRMARAAEQGFNTGETFYHGSAARFPNFRPGRVNDTTHEAHPVPATFMTSDPALASEYAGSAAKGRMSNTADIYARNNRDIPYGRYYDTRSPGDIEKAARKLYQQAADAIPEDFEAAVVLKGLVANQQFRTRDLSTPALQKHFPQDVIDRVLSLRKQGDDLLNAPDYRQGAQLYPLLAPRDVLDVDSGFFGGSFNPVMFDKLLETAKGQGRAGLRIRNVVDSPSGTGPPADVMAVFDPRNIRSRFAAFDPERRGSSDLLAGLLGPLMAGTAAAALPDNTSPEATKRAMPGGLLGRL